MKEGRKKERKLKFIIFYVITIFKSVLNETRSNHSRMLIHECTMHMFCMVIMQHVLKIEFHTSGPNIGAVKSTLMVNQCADDLSTTLFYKL